jgi:molybdenum cofactor guanylyltransferase
VPAPVCGNAGLTWNTLVRAFMPGRAGSDPAGRPCQAGPVTDPETGPADLAGSPGRPDGTQEPPERPDAVIVVAGGRSRRFGADKLDVLLDRVLDGFPASTGRIVCVGPVRQIGRDDVHWTIEVPAGSGPLAAVAAGLAHLRDHPAADGWIVAIAGGDMPGVARAVPALVRAARAAGSAVLADSDGRAQLLASAWRVPVLAERLAQIGDPAGRPLQELLLGLAVVTVPDSWAAAVDVDTPADLDRLDDRDKLDDRDRLHDSDS